MRNQNKRRITTDRLPEQVTLGDADQQIEFQIYYINPFEVKRLEKKILPMLAPMLSGITEDSTTFDFSSIMGALSALSDDEYIRLLDDLLSAAATFVPGKGVVSCSMAEGGAEVFVGKSYMMYELAFEVMRVNKFVPFDGLGGGSQMPNTQTSSPSASASKASGIPLARSAS